MMPHIRAHLLKAIAAGSALILLGGVIGYVAFTENAKRCWSSNGYLAPQAGCVNPGIDKGSYNDLRNSLIAYINTQKENGKASEVSVYYRDLNEGPTFGIDQYEAFAPASLLKLPLALAYMRMSESNPGLLSTTLRFTEDPPVYPQFYKPQYVAQKNTSYTISELLRYMVAYSDNAAYAALYTYLEQLPDGPSSLYRMYKDLGIDTDLLEVATSTVASQDIDAQTYGSIFRSLYFSSLLDSNSSQQVIQWLLQSDFHDGLEAKMPADVPVADKFGERSYLDGTKELHDCGIVYYPDNPYALCIMTKGSDWTDLSSIIETISKQVYDEVDSRAH